MRDGIVVAAPCKINIHLRIGDRRSDGFHDIESVFQALSFGDTLRIESLKERSVCDLSMDGPVPPERNIVYAAVSVFRRATGFDGGVRIRIEKRVPFGAGLGAGSSDAASALRALDAVAGTGLPPEELRRMAASLGSDVPFFLSGGTALVTGRGEHVLPLNVDLAYTVLLVNPGIHSDTAGAYRDLDRMRETDALVSSSELGAQKIAAALVAPLRDWPFFNDFQAVLGANDACYDGILTALRAHGADFVGISGSGSTCFGLFSNPQRAEMAEKELKTRWPFVQSALPLARSSSPVLE